MGGKSKPDNSAVVNEQKAEAAAAAAKEAARQERLQTGLKSIKSAFEGSPVMKSQTSPYDWSSFKPANPAAAAWAAQNPNAGFTASQFGPQGVPEGYTAVQANRPAASAGGRGTSANPYARTATTTDPYADTRAVANLNINTAAVNNQTGGGRNQYAPDTVAAPAGGGGASVWALKGPDGKLHYQGDPLDVTTNVDTGQKSGGFDDAFYNKYKQAVLDYYMPQVSKQYKDAGDELTYRLARSGNVLSSAGNTATADLAEQNALNQANVRNQADTASGDLRTQVASEENKAISQLYATEDPEVAANTALSSVRDISLKQPDLSPLAGIFNIASVGGANILKGYQGGQLANAYKTALASTGTGRNQRLVNTG
jgi:hypothetical protein